MPDKQLALALYPNVLKQFSNLYHPFYPKAVELAQQFIASCGQVAEIYARNSLYFYGESGTGKTHLIQAVGEECSKQGVYTLYLPLAKLVEQSPEVLKGAELADCICIDDVDVLQTATLEWRTAVFEMVNSYVQQRKVWVCTGSVSLVELNTGLPDLNSRLRLSAQAALVPEFSDDTLFSFMRWLCEQKSININDQQINYLCQRVPRDIGIIAGIISELDDVVWQNNKTLKKNLYYKFLKEFLEQRLN